MKIRRILCALPLLAGPAAAACYVPVYLGNSSAQPSLTDAGESGAEVLDADPSRPEGIDASVVEDAAAPYFDSSSDVFLDVDQGPFSFEAGAGSISDAQDFTAPDVDAELDMEGGLDVVAPSFDF